jgi:hypothetical protein
MLVPLVNFAPDAEPGTTGTLQEALGFMPTERGMRSAPSAQATGYATAPAEVYGAAIIERSNGTKKLYMATASDLFEGDGTAWTTVTRASGAYAATAAPSWYFASFGNDALAANLATTLQVSSGAEFSNITASPKAAIVETAGLFALCFDVDDDSFTHPDGWWASAQANVRDWVPSIATGSVRGRLLSTPGPIKAARALGDQMVAYKASGLYLGTQVGPPIWWAWQLVPGDAGCVGPHAVAPITVQGAPAHFVVGPRGMYVFDGSRPVTVGEGLVTRWFLSNLNPNFAHRTSCLVDRTEGAVYVLFANAQSAGELNDCLIYSFRFGGRFGRGRDYVARMGLQYAKPASVFADVPDEGITFDEIDASTFDALFGGADVETPAIFTTGDRLKTLNGSGTTSSLRTAFSGADGAISLVRRVRPRFTTAPGAASLVLQASDNLSGIPQAAVSATFADNRFDVLSEARWHAFDLEATGGCELSALEVDIKLVSEE